MTSVYQGLCLSRSMGGGGGVGENPGNEVETVHALFKWKFNSGFRFSSVVGLPACPKLPKRLFQIKHQAWYCSAGIYV